MLEDVLVSVIVSVRARASVCGRCVQRYVIIIVSGGRNVSS